MPDALRQAKSSLDILIYYIVIADRGIDMSREQAPRNLQCIENAKWSASPTIIDADHDTGIADGRPCRAWNDKARPAQMLGRSRLVLRGLVRNRRRPCAYGLSLT